MSFQKDLILSFFKMRDLYLTDKQTSYILFQNKVNELLNKFLKKNRYKY